jgi:hypothetical protein
MMRGVDDGAGLRTWSRVLTLEHLPKNASSLRLVDGRAARSSSKHFRTPGTSLLAMIDKIKQFEQ